MKNLGKNYNYVVFLIPHIFSYWHVSLCSKSNFKKVSAWGLGDSLNWNLHHAWIALQVKF